MYLTKDTMTRGGDGVLLCNFIPKIHDTGGVGADEKWQEGQRGSHQSVVIALYPSHLPPPALMKIELDGLPVVSM